MVSPERDGEELEEAVGATFAKETIGDLLCDHCSERRDDVLYALK
jgi:hypothetical protein